MSFDWEFYLRYHADLFEALPYTEEAAKTHFETFGMNEGRATSMNQIKERLPESFDLDRYIESRTDLHLPTRESYLYHYVNVDLPEERLSEDVARSSHRSIISRYVPTSRQPRTCVIFYHAITSSAGTTKLWDKCVSSVLNQSYQDFDLLELNYGGSENSLTKSYDLAGHKCWFHTRNLPNRAHAQNYCITTAFEMGYEIVFDTNIEDFYHHDRFWKQVKLIDDGCELVGMSTRGRCATFAVDDSIVMSRSTAYTQRLWNSYDCNGNLFRYRNIVPLEEVELWRIAHRSNVRIGIVDDVALYRQTGIITNTDISQPVINETQLSSKRIGIAIVATGKYTNYVVPLINQCRERFLPRYTRIFYVWTDDLESIPKDDDIVCTKIVRHGYPGDTLYRYHYMLMREWELITNTDVIYYIDVDMQINQCIDDNILPSPDKPLISVIHFMYHDGYCGYGTLEESRKSTAYVPPRDKNGKYLAGALQGGYTYHYLSMAKEIAEHIDIDDYNEYVATWDDESHYNRYATYNRDKFRQLPYEYCAPPDPSNKVYINSMISCVPKDYAVVRTTSDVYITINLRGELGDQLFLVSCLLTVAEEYGLIPHLCVRNYDPNIKTRTFRHSIFRDFLRIKDVDDNYYIYEESKPSYEKIELPKGRHVRLDGYFQSWKYFNRNFDLVSNLFPTGTKVRAKKIYDNIANLMSEDTMAIRIHWDNDGANKSLDIDFYRRCIERLGAEKSYVIFTDDVARCKRDEFNHLWKSAYFVHEEDPVLELLIMSNCRSLIVNDSTSCWAAYLSGSEEVYYSTEWRRPDGNVVVYEDVILPHWRKIPDDN